MHPIRRLISARPITQQSLEAACRAHHPQLGFRPAFLDIATFAIHLSRFADGRPAPFHMLDGLPDEVVVARSIFGRAVAAKATLVRGFERNGFFYTRTAAARAAAEWSSCE